MAFTLEATHGPSGVRYVIGPYPSSESAWDRVETLSRNPTYDEYTYHVKHLKPDSIFAPVGLVPVE